MRFTLIVLRRLLLYWFIDKEGKNSVFFLTSKNEIYINNQRVVPPAQGVLRETTIITTRVQTKWKNNTGTTNTSTAIILFPNKE